MRNGREDATRERLLDRLVPEPNSGCWLWEGAITEAGYGVMSVGGRLQYVHRLSYATFIGCIPTGLVIDHLCRVRCCANPLHLEVVTHFTNDMRGESPLARNAVKTKCVRGHEFTPDNTYLLSGGQRQCRACYRIRSSEYKARKRALGGM